MFHSWSLPRSVTASRKAKAKDLVEVWWPNLGEINSAVLAIKAVVAPPSVETSAPDLEDISPSRWAEVDLPWSCDPGLARDPLRSKLLTNTSQGSPGVTRSRPLPFHRLIVICVTSAAELNMETAALGFMRRTHTPVTANTLRTWCTEG